ncbi:MAG: hypothetical protein AAFY88_04520, partial [Acidobacteriota bacterium]
MAKSDKERVEVHSADVDVGPHGNRRRRGGVSTDMLRPILISIALAAPSASAGADDATLTLAVRSGDAAFKRALAEAPMQRWILPENPNVRLEVAPRATGDVTLETCALPTDQEDRPDLEGLPLRFKEYGFEFAGEPYRDPQLAFAVRRPSSRRWVVCGFTPEASAALADRVLRQEAGVRFWRRQEPFDYLIHEHDYSRRAGHWRVTEGVVEPDPDERNDMRTRAATYAALVPIERPSVRVHVPAAGRNDPRGPALADALHGDVPRLRQRLGVKTAATERPVDVLVEGDYVEQGRHVGRIDPAVVADDRLHLVFHEDDTDFYRVETGRLLLRRAGLDLPPMLEDGAALWLAERWYGRHFKAWMPDLAFADVLPTADELRRADRPGDGSRVLFPIAVAWGLDQLPGETLRQKLTGDPLPAVAAALAGYRAPPGPEPSPPPKAVALPFQRGVSFAMANGLEVGYHARGVDDQLERLGAMGVDAVSLMPFAYQRDPTAPGLAFLNDSPSSETDVGAVHAARRARAAGFYVLWKPHIWVSYDSWPGDIAMDSDAEWRSWWRSYRRYILHHAILARFAGADLFSLGVELGKTVHREAEWRHLIASVRRLDVSPLTYAGNWAGDYDQAPFWDALDVVGIDAYFPLSTDDDATDADLRRGARAIVDRLAADAERYQKPILLTEVGFAARQGAWVVPHKEGGDLSDAHQERAWKALLEALGR